MDIYGTDIKLDFNFNNGDLELVSGTDNLGQAIINRLNTYKGFYDCFYTNYGGDLQKIYGMENNTNSLEYLRIEIESILLQDPRIKEITCECTKENTQTVNAELEILPISKDEIVTLNLVIQDDLIVLIDDKYMEVKL